MTSIEQYLTQRFSDLGQNLDEITSAFAPMSIKKGTHFLEAGKKCQQIAFIESGVMRNYHIDERGNEVVNYMTCEGEFNTVYKYFQSQEVCPEHIQAVTNCELRGQQLLGGTGPIIPKFRLTGLRPKKVI